jgi:hypothetical protein
VKGPAPPSVDFSTAHWSTENHHEITVAMIRAGITVFSGRPAKFGHRYKHNLRPPVSHIRSECTQRSSVLYQEIGKLRSFVDVVTVVVEHAVVHYNVPHSMVGAGRLKSKFGKTNGFFAQ